MIENQMLTKARAERSIAGSSRMGKKVVLETLRLFGASSDTFGEDLVKGIEVLKRKRDADFIFHLDDIELLHLVKKVR
jgi:hypothetical protein